MRLIRHRREPQIIQTYAVKCAMHYHAHRMVQELLARPQFADKLVPGTHAASSPVPGIMSRPSLRKCAMVAPAGAGP